MDRAVAAAAAAAVAAALISWRYFYAQLAHERALRERAEALRAQDRTGRIRAEKALRDGGDRPRVVSKRMAPIGYLKSCFKVRFPSFSFYFNIF